MQNPAKNPVLYVTAELSLEFWLRLQNRIEHELACNRHALLDRVQPRTATLDTLKTVAERAAQDRAVVLSTLTAQENLLLLRMALARQVEEASVGVGLTELGRDLAYMRDWQRTLQETMCGLPLRKHGEEDLANANVQFDSLKNSGQGETINAQRQHWRSLACEIRPVGQEDGAPYETEVRRLQTLIDQREAEMQSLRVNTLLALRVTEDLEATLLLFSIGAAAVPQAGHAPAPATTAEQAPAQAADQVSTSTADNAPVPA